MNQYNVWNKWSKLKTVMLGDSYHSEFFRDIKNKKIRSALQRIADETQEDLEYYKQTLKEFGCCVLRPNLDHNDSIMNYINIDGKVSGSQGVPRSPLQPRDCQLVIGNHLYYTSQDHDSIRKCLDLYNNVDSTTWYQLTTIDQHCSLRHFTPHHWNIVAGSDWGTYEDYLYNPDYFEKLPESIKNEVLEFHKRIVTPVTAPSITVIGRDVYVDQGDQKFQQHQVDTLTKNISNVRVNTLNHGGHSDGCFHTIKEGAILSLEQIQTYENTFPGWDVCYLPDQSWSKVKGFLKLKTQVSGKWWVPGEEENREFTHFVETWLQDWVGYVEESVFDVNVLVLDEHHVCVNNMNPTVIEFLKKHHMEPVHIPWRHRYFWDGGLHCITLDLEREGVQEDYFPDRGDAGVIDHGFD